MYQTFGYKMHVPYKCLHSMFNLKELYKHGVRIRSKEEWCVHMWMCMCWSTNVFTSHLHKVIYTSTNICEEMHIHTLVKKHSLREEAVWTCEEMGVRRKRYNKPNGCSQRCRHGWWEVQNYVSSPNLIWHHLEREAYSLSPMYSARFPPPNEWIHPFPGRNRRDDDEWE